MSETRIAILRRQVKVDAYTIGEPEVLEYIASRVSTNIRELVGALRRVVSYASITHGEVTLEVAREALKDILPKPYTQPITIEAVQSEVARQFGCHVSDLRGDKRTADVAYPRHIAMYLCRELTEASLPQIGGASGPRPQHRPLRRQQDRAPHAGRSRPPTPRPRPGHHLTLADRSLSGAPAPLARPVDEQLCEPVENVARRRQTGYACRVRSRLGEPGAPSPHALHTTVTSPASPQTQADSRFPTLSTGSMTMMECFS